ncbi:MAG: UbiA family prenyltransferase, partial [Burkholderiales bacterium]
MTAQELRARIDLYERLMRLDKPIGTLLLLWPTLWAVWIAAAGEPHWAVVGIFTLGTLLMRSAGCVMNDVWDAGFDAQVERTRGRPLATGQVSRREALMLVVMLVLMAFALVLVFNPLTIGLS